MKEIRNHLILQKVVDVQFELPNPFFFHKKSLNLFDFVLWECDSF